MKTNLIGLVIAAAIGTSVSVFADEPGEHRSEPAGDQLQGQYRAQDVQQWIPGRYAQVYVPFCRAARWGQVRCHGGTSESRWVPGYYAAVQQPVWAPSVVVQPQQYGLYQWGYRTHRYAQGRGGVRVSFGFH
jgi:hypothetical protein